LATTYDLITLPLWTQVTNFPNKGDHDMWLNNMKSQGNEWKYRNLLQNPIEFKHNSMGYRTHEFDFGNDDEYIIHIGCSNTYGQYLHEHERASNLIETNLDIKTYNLASSGGSSNYIMMNIANLLYNVSNKPKAVVIQWPNLMRLNYPYISSDIMPDMLRIMPSQNWVNCFIQGVNNPMETHSKWCRQHTLNLLNRFDINTIEYTLETVDEADAYGVSRIERIDSAYDCSHIGTLTNEHIFNYVKEQL
jgi:hypothetical protein